MDGEKGLPRALPGLDRTSQHSDGSAESLTSVLIVIGSSDSSGLPKFFGRIARSSSCRSAQVRVAAASHLSCGTTAREYLARIRDPGPHSGRHCCYLLLGHATSTYDSVGVGLTGRYRSPNTLTRRSTDAACTGPHRAADRARSSTKSGRKAHCRLYQEQRQRSLGPRNASRRLIQHHPRSDGHVLITSLHGQSLLTLETRPIYMPAGAFAPHRHFLLL